MISQHLSILIAASYTRIRQSQHLIADLCKQAEGKPVEVLAFVDNHTRSVGAKRNELLKWSRGLFSVFVDDDDKVSPLFVDTLLAAISDNQGADCITFGIRRKNCAEPSILWPRLGASERKLLNNTLEMPASHIAAWKTDVARSVPFPDISMGEDNRWTDAIVNRAKEGARLDAILYEYHFNPNTSLTQNAVRRPVPLVDVDHSILVPTVPRRFGNCFDNLLGYLSAQASGKRVEVLGFFDNKMRTVGAKRNGLLHAARGQYLSFVDDDDQVSTDYVEKIGEAISQPPASDVVVYNQLLHRAGKIPKLCEYSLSHKGYYDGAQKWTGPPAHTMTWRRDVAQSHDFPEKNYTEDSSWVKLVRQNATTEKVIPQVLYHYHFDPNTSETRSEAAKRVGRK